MQYCAPRPNDPALFPRWKMQSRQFFAGVNFHLLPGDTAVCGMLHRPFIADNPALLVVRKSDRIQARRCPRWANGPVSAAGTGEKNLAARTDRPTMHVIAKEDMG